MLFYIEILNIRGIFIPLLLSDAEEDYAMNFYDDPTHIRPLTWAGLYYYLSGNGDEC